MRKYRSRHDKEKPIFQINSAQERRLIDASTAPGAFGPAQLLQIVNG
jgi:hypothetical protein